MLYCNYTFPIDLAPNEILFHLVPKRIVSKLSKIRSSILIAQIEDLNEDTKIKQFSVVLTMKMTSYGLKTSVYIST